MSDSDFKDTVVRLLKSIESRLGDLNQLVANETNNELGNIVENTVNAGELEKVLEPILEKLDSIDRKLSDD